VIRRDRGVKGRLSDAMPSPAQVRCKATTPRSFAVVTVATAVARLDPLGCCLEALGAHALGKELHARIPCALRGLRSQHLVQPGSGPELACPLIGMCVRWMTNGTTARGDVGGSSGGLIRCPSCEPDPGRDAGPELHLSVLGRTGPARRSSGFDTSRMANYWPL
jgi:hypothetical protein